MNKSILLLFLLLFGSCSKKVLQPVTPLALHVSISGNDQNIGSMTLPYRTIQYAVDHASSGQTIFIHEGIYREGIIIPSTKKGIKLIAYEQEKPMLKGSDVITGWKPLNNYWYKIVPIQTQQVMVDGNNPLQQIGFPNESFLKNDTQRKRYQYPVGKDLSDMEHGRFYWANDSLYIALEDGTNPNNHQIEVSQRKSILDVEADNVFIKGLFFRHSNANTFVEQGAAVELGNYSIIEDCDVQWCDFGGISLGYAKQGTKALRCIASNNGATGFNAAATQDFLVQDCIANKNNYRNFYALWHAGGFKAASSAWGTIENSEFGNNIGAGIWFDYCFERAKYRTNGQQPIIVRNNYIHCNSLYPERNHNAAVMFEVSEKIEFYNNLLVNNGHRGVYVSASWDVNVYNNTFSGTTGYCTIDIAGIPRGDHAKLTNVKVVNNIVYNSKTKYDLHLLVPNDIDIDLPVCDYNLYYREGSKSVFWNSTDGRDNWQGEIIDDLKKWRNITGFDQHSLDINPLFIEKDTVFHVAQQSPVIDAGDNKVAKVVLSDYSGQSRVKGKSIDIGIHEK